MSGILNKAQKMLANAETPDEYLDAALALNLGTKFTLRLANDVKTRERLMAILEELIDIRRQIILHTVQDNNISEASGGGVPESDDVTTQIWPDNLDD